MVPEIFWLGPIFTTALGAQGKNVFLLLNHIFCFCCHRADSTALALCWQGFDVSKGFSPFSQHSSRTPGGLCVLTWLWEPRQLQILSQELFEVFPHGWIPQGGHAQLRGRAGWAWLVPRVLSLQAASQEQDFWETSLCFHAGSVLAQGCWHFDVSWRSSREVAVEKWQHKTLINVSKESQAEEFPLSCLHFHMQLDSAIEMGCLEQARLIIRNISPSAFKERWKNPPKALYKRSWNVNSLINRSNTLPYHPYPGVWVLI